MSGFDAGGDCEQGVDKQSYAENEGIFSDALTNVKGRVVDELTKQLAEKIRDITNGSVNVDAILKGQVKIDANGYIDKVLATVSEKIEDSRVNNIELPAHKMAFEKSVLCGLVLPGEVDFQNGLISGLSSLCRMDDSSLQINAFDDPIITARAAIGIKEALVNYLANVTCLCINQDESKISGGLKDIHLIVALKVSRDFTVSLDQFEVKSTGSLTLGGFETLGLFDFLKDTISADMQITIKDAVKKYLENTVQNFTEEVLGKLPLKF